jgi:elongation factor G
MGVRTEIQRLWAGIRDAGLPCLIFVNGLDKDGTSFTHTVEAIGKELGVAIVPLVIPVGTEAQLSGVIDLLRSVLVTPMSERPQAQEGPVPPELASAADEGLRRMMEEIAETDEAFLERYLASNELSASDLLAGLKAAVQRGTLIPVLGGSAAKLVGVHTLLSAVTAFLPSPVDRAQAAPLQGRGLTDEASIVVRQPAPTDPFSGFIFKTIIDPFLGRLSYVRIYSGTLEADKPVYNASRHVKEKGGHLFSIFGKKYQSIPRAAAGEVIAIGKLRDSLTGDTLCDEHAPIRYAGITVPRPVVSFAIEPKSKAEIEKVSLGLHKLIEEDPSLEFVRNAETKEMVFSGMGQLHIDVALEKLHRKYGADVTLHTPKIPYRETIRSTSQAQGKYKKQTGGHGQYGDCWLELSPLPRGKGFEFENKVVGGAIPRNFIPAVEKGVVEAMSEGVLAGYPVVDVRVTVYDGSYHVVDSSELAFKIAASMGFKKAMEGAHPVLLEPVMTVEVDAPDDCIGSVIGDLNSRRGRIVTVMANGQTETVTATVPLADMLKYAPVLNSITAGRGRYVMEYAHYEEVPREIAARVIEEHKAGRQAVAAH